MATTAAIAPTTAGGTSADIVVPVGAVAILTLFRASGAPVASQVNATINKKNSSGGYGPTTQALQMGPMGAHRGNSVTLTAGTYQVILPATSDAVGVDLDQ